MATTVACRECGDSFTISPEHLGRKYRCKSCGAVNVAEDNKSSGDRTKRSSPGATRRKPPQRTSQQRAAGASQKPRKPQKKRRPKPAPEPTYDEYSYDYDEAEYESYETYEDYDAVEEYQPSRSRSRRSSGKKRSARPLGFRCLPSLGRRSAVLSERHCLSCLSAAAFCELSLTSAEQSATCNLAR